MLFYGPSGAGKKTRIACTLKELFGKGVEKVCDCCGPCHSDTEAISQLKIDQRVFLTPSRRKLDVNIVQSNFHLEITPRYVSFWSPSTIIVDVVWLHSEVGNYDRVVIQELLKEIAQTQQVDINARHRFKGMRHTFNKCLRTHCI
jgi:replication factor C subunit 3/5